MHYNYYSLLSYQPDSSKNIKNKEINRGLRISGTVLRATFSTIKNTPPRPHTRDIECCVTVIDLFSALGMVGCSRTQLPTRRE